MVTCSIERTNWKENLFPVASHLKSHFKRNSSLYVSARLLCLRCILILSLAITSVLFFLLFLLSFAVFRFVAFLLCLIFNVIYLPHIVTDWARTRGATKPTGWGNRQTDALTEWLTDWMTCRAFFIIGSLPAAFACLLLLVFLLWVPIPLYYILCTIKKTNTYTHMWTRAVWNKFGISNNQKCLHIISFLSRLDR